MLHIKHETFKMPKCGKCGKFLTIRILSTKSIRCCRCPNAYHRACVDIGSSANQSSWLCPECKGKSVKEDRQIQEVKSLKEDRPTVETKSSRDDLLLQESKILKEDRSSQEIKSSREDRLSQENKVSKEDRLVPEINLVAPKRSIRTDVKKIRSELREFREELIALKICITSCNYRVDSLEGKMTEVDEHLKKDRGLKIKQLEAIVEDIQKRLAFERSTAKELGKSGSFRSHDEGKD